MNGYSDWEYYSDDYWDEDPSTAKRTIQQPSAKGETQKRGSSTSGKKRKRTEQPNAPLKRSKRLEADLQPNQILYGTVWKTDTGQTDDEGQYIPGQQKRIGLLKDWRDIFRDSQPRSDRRREERSVVSKKRHISSTVGENLEEDEVGPINRTKATSHGERSTPKKRSRGEQGLISENHRSTTFELEPEAEPPSKRRPRLEMGETQEKQNGVITNSILVAGVEKTIRQENKKRPRADEAHEPPPEAKRVAPQPADTNNAQKPEHETSRSTRATRRRKA